jgi:hypothetical protein
MNKSLSIIIPYSNKSTILEELIRSAWTLKPMEIIVLLQSSQQELNDIAIKHKCHVVCNDDSDYIPGLKVAKGEALLVLDGTFSISATEISEFITPIMNVEADVALNNISGIIEINTCPNIDIVWRKMLNEIMHRPDLKGNSLVSMPCAYTKQVVESIGYENFRNVALAHMMLVEQGWRISHHYSINTLSRDELVKEENYLFKETLSADEKKKVNKYVDVVAKWLQKKDSRGAFTDSGKRRDIIQQLDNVKHFPSYQQGWGMTSSIYNGKQLSVIIPAQDEQETIGLAILEARKIEPYEILVIVNGSSDRTSTIAASLGATVIEYVEPLGHNIGRAIGALEAKGDILLFIDSDFSIPARDLHYFTRAVADGVDIALNDLLPSLKPPFYIVDILKFMLNTAYYRPELSNGSLVAIPHAISKSCLDIIGWESLLCPSLAQVKAILGGCKVECTHYVDVIKPNRIRAKEHISKNGHPPAVLRIMGDHIEALSYLIEQFDRKVD